jgi:hypothetical protein
LIYVAFFARAVSAAKAFLKEIYEGAGCVSDSLVCASETDLTGYGVADTSDICLTRCSFNGSILLFLELLVTLFDFGLIVLLSLDYPLSLISGNTTVSFIFAKKYVLFYL